MKDRLLTSRADLRREEFQSNRHGKTLSLEELQAANVIPNPTSPHPKNETFNDRWLHLSIVTREVGGMVAAAEKWAKDAMGNHPGAPKLLVLCGDNGVGKTMCLRGLLRYFTAARIAAWELEFWPKGPPELAFTFWSKWANLDLCKAEDCDLFRELTRPDVLLLDDVGAEADRYKSGAGVANLTELLSRRAEKWTALTMNYLPETWIGTEAVPGRFGKRVGDRLFRNSTIVPIRKTPSWAATHRQP